MTSPLSVGGGAAREWVAGSFAVSTALGSYEIAGWVKPPFALDFRTFDDGDDWIKSGWHLTHLPSGFGMCGIIANLATAKALADEILAIADWSFDDPEAAKAIGSVFTEWRKEHGAKIVRAASVSNPLRCEASS